MSATAGGGNGSSPGLAHPGDKFKAATEALLDHIDEVLEEQELAEAKMRPKKQSAWS